MTGYDPFSYGQIRLDDEANANADSPDEILFRDAGPMPRPSKTTDDMSDWELPTSNGDPLTGGMPDPNLAKADFGADILGETAPAPSVPAHSSGSPSGGPAAEHVEAADMQHSGMRLPLRSRPIASRPHSAGRRPARPLGVILPPVVLLAGAGVTAWLYLMQQNMIMAGIAAAMTIVGTAFTRVLFR